MLHLSVLSVIPWVWWLVGFLGVGGTVALFIFAPAVANAITEAVFGVVRALLKTRVGVAILVAVIVGTLGWLDGDLHGRLKERKLWTAANAAAEAARVARDVAIAKSSEAKFQPVIDDLQERLAKYESKKDGAVDSCKLSPADIRRLRKLGR
jgi:hypothetical protein